ncbi:MFS transporter [Polycladomyces sp. WAk]|uniref:MFS transporter n=1 Tax=Polycladomyces zharkentensis TaxID=2807616 RepID=A0ABS2WL60_9BACL|nr:MFS transporter [Polycladomyces sp. WAk]
MVYSAGSFGTKVGTGLGSALIGWILALGGYVGGSATQTDSALLAIKALFIYIPLAIGVIQFVLLLFYKLDKEYPLIIQELHQRRGEVRL